MDRLIFRCWYGFWHAAVFSLANIVVGKMNGPLSWRQRSRMYFNTGTETYIESDTFVVRLLTDLTLISPNHSATICATRSHILPRQMPSLLRISPEHDQWLDSYVKLYDWDSSCCDITFTHVQVVMHNRLLKCAECVKLSMQGFSLTKVSVRWHPANGVDGDNGQQARAHKGADAGEEEEETHDGTLHWPGGCWVGKLQTCG